MNTPAYSQLLSPSSVGGTSSHQQQTSLVTTPELLEDMRSEVTHSLSIDPSSLSHDTHSTISTMTTASTQHHHHQQQPQKKVFKTEYKSKFTPFDQYVYNEVTDSFVKQQQLRAPSTNSCHPSPSSSSSQQQQQQQQHMTSSRSNQDISGSHSNHQDHGASAQEAHLFEPSQHAADLHSVTGTSNEPWYKEVVRRNEKANEYRFKSEVGHQSPLLHNYTATTIVTTRADSPYCSERQMNSPSTCANESLAGDQHLATSSDAKSQHGSDHHQSDGASEVKFRFTPHDYKRDHLIAHMANNNNFAYAKERETSATRHNRSQVSSSARSTTRTTAQLRSRSQSSRRQPAPSSTTGANTTRAGAATAQSAAKSHQTTPTRTVTNRTAPTARPPAASSVTRSATTKQSTTTTTKSSSAAVAAKTRASRPATAATTHGRPTPTSTTTNTRRAPSSTPTSRSAPKTNGTTSIGSSRPSPSVTNVVARRPTTARATPVTSKAAPKPSTPASSSTPTRQRPQVTSTTSSRPLSSARPTSMTSSNAGPAAKSKTPSRTPSSTATSSPTSSAGSTTAVKSIKTPKATAAAAAAAATLAATTSALALAATSGADVESPFGDKNVAVAADTPTVATNSEAITSVEPLTVTGPSGQLDGQFDAFGRQQSRSNDPFSTHEEPNLIFATSEGGNMLADELAQAEKDASNLTRNIHQPLNEEIQQQLQNTETILAAETSEEHVPDSTELKQHVAAESNSGDKGEGAKESSSDSDSDNETDAVKPKPASSDSESSKAEIVNGLAGGLISAEDRFDSSEREVSSDLQHADHQQDQREQEPNFDDEPYSIIPTPTPTPVQKSEVKRKDDLEDDDSFESEAKLEPTVESEIKYELNENPKSEVKIDTVVETESVQGELTDVIAKHESETIAQVLDNKPGLEMKQDLTYTDHTHHNVESSTSDNIDLGDVSRESNDTNRADETRESDDMLTLNDTAAALIDVLDTGGDSQIVTSALDSEGRRTSVDSSDSDGGESLKEHNFDAQNDRLGASKFGNDEDDLMSNEPKHLIDSSPALVSANSTFQELDVSVISADAAPASEQHEENKLDDIGNTLNDIQDNGDLQGNRNIDIKQQEDNENNNNDGIAESRDDMVQEALEKVVEDKQIDNNADILGNDDNDVISSVTNEQVQQPVERQPLDLKQEQQQQQQLEGGENERETKEKGAASSQSDSSDDDGSGLEKRNELVMNVADLIGVESQKREEMARKSEQARKNSSPQPLLAQVNEVILSPDQLNEHFVAVDEDNLKQKSSPRSSSSSSSSISLIEDEAKRSEDKHPESHNNTTTVQDEKSDPSQGKLSQDLVDEEVVADPSSAMETNLMGEEMGRVSLQDDEMDDENQRLSNHLTNSEDELILAPRNYNYDQSSSAQVASQLRESTGIDLLAQDDRLDGDVELGDGLNATIETPTAAETRVEMSTSKSMVPEISQTNYMFSRRLSDDSDDEIIGDEKDPLEAAATISPSSSATADELLRFNSVKDSVLENSLPDENQLKQQIREMASGIVDNYNNVDTNGQKKLIESVSVTENVIDDTVKQLSKEEITSNNGGQESQAQHGELYRQLNISQQERRVSSGFDESTLRRKQSTKSTSSSSSTSNSLEEVPPMDLKSQYDEFASKMSTELMVAQKNDNNNTTVTSSSGHAEAGAELTTDASHQQSPVQEAPKTNETTDLMG